MTYKLSQAATLRKTLKEAREKLWNVLEEKIFVINFRYEKKVWKSLLNFFKSFEIQLILWPWLQSMLIEYSNNERS